MSEKVQPGDWVRIHKIILPPGERAPGIPADTALHPYEGWINGFAAEESRVGEQVAIRTLSGRLVQGTLVEARPGFTHGFGRPHRALLAVGRSLRKLLDERAE